MGEKLSPAQASEKLKELGIDEDSWGAVMGEHPSVQMATGHELKALVTIAKGSEALDFTKVYDQMRKNHPK